MEHYILCASMYMCIVLDYASQAACLRGFHQFQFELRFWVARLVTTRGPGTYCSQYVLTIFLFAGFRSIRYVLQLYGLGSKLHTCILFIVYVHYMIMNATRYYLFSVQVNQYFYSVPVKSVFIISTSSASTVCFCQYQNFSIQLQLFLSSLLIAELCSSPYTLHHSRF